MAITLEQEEKKRTKYSFSLPLWAFATIIAVLVFGTISYFLFFGEKEKVNLKEAKEGLSKAEIRKVRDVLRYVEGGVFKGFIVVLPESDISEPLVDPGRVGKGNPFAQ